MINDGGLDACSHMCFVEADRSMGSGKQSYINVIHNSNFPIAQFNSKIAM